MNYLIAENNIITNIIVADEAFAASIGAKPYYVDAAIGAAYDPPTLDKLHDGMAVLAETLADFMYQSNLEKLNGGTTL